MSGCSRCGLGTRGCNRCRDPDYIYPQRFRWTPGKIYSSSDCSRIKEKIESSNKFFLLDNVARVRSGDLQSDVLGHGLVLEQDMKKDDILICANSYFSTTLPPKVRYILTFTLAFLF